ncbi:hypothetical protein B0H19DRAFT_1057147 [Mycena capillaripes]|nr:hypothetical protein B0H19DRAFT_1057147 [Mycena capillaripes]
MIIPQRSSSPTSLRPTRHTILTPWESSEALHASLVLGILLVAFSSQWTVEGGVDVTFSRSSNPKHPGIFDGAMVCGWLHVQICWCYAPTSWWSARSPLYLGPYPLCRLDSYVSKGTLRQVVLCAEIVSRHTLLQGHPVPTWNYSLEFHADIMYTAIRVSYLEDVGP